MIELIEQVIKTNVPTKIFVGTLEKTQEFTTLVLQRYLCLKKSSEHSDLSECFCRECQNIKNRQHYNIMWLSPSKNYTVTDIDLILDKIRFVLDKNHKFFFILDNAHTLTTVTANRLLKILEEPPVGYNFFLLTTNIYNILPTIISRAYVLTFTGESRDSQIHPLLNIFCDKNFFEYSTEQLQGEHTGLRPVPSSPKLASQGMGGGCLPSEKHTGLRPVLLPLSSEFESILKKFKPTEIETIELLDDLLEYFIKLSSLESNKKIRDIINYIIKFRKMPPGPGSCDIFWKTFYLNFPI